MHAYQQIFVMRSMCYTIFGVCDGVGALQKEKVPKVIWCQFD